MSSFSLELWLSPQLVDISSTSSFCTLTPQSINGNLLWFQTIFIENNYNSPGFTICCGFGFKIQDVKRIPASRFSDEKVPYCTRGGDDGYLDEDEEKKEFISRWARRKVSVQFSKEFLDGRKGFIFSWDKKPWEIHEQALCFSLTQARKGRGLNIIHHNARLSQKL